MKKAIFVLLILFLVTSIVYAEPYEDAKAGVKFNIPDGFKKIMDSETSKSWNGPKKGAMIWSINLNITPIPKGVASSQMCTIHFNSDKGNKKQFSSVEKIKINGASGGALLIKEVKKADSDIYRWNVKAFGKNKMYSWIFAGSYPTFKEYGPMIKDIIKSTSISK